MSERPLTGEPLPLDLLNTTWNGSAGLVDFLASGDGVRAFSLQHGVIVDTDVSAVTASLRQARQAIRTLLTDRADADLTSVRRLLQSARVSADAQGITLHAEPEAHLLAVRAVHEAVELLHDKAERVRSCAHPSCVLWFLDTTRSGTRRWCSMATCGNRTKAKRFAEARRSES
ncbi:MAG: CGNR zinc finger domain-containing protein [Myxococcales bacterium]|nr:CGNR zinc finger domain-containing protein [Myxococcales bacterium]